LDFASPTKLVLPCRAREEIYKSGNWEIKGHFPDSIRNKCVMSTENQNSKKQEIAAKLKFPMVAL
jgi:hypothetical protein